MTRVNLSTLHAMICSLLPDDIDVNYFCCYCFQLAVFTQCCLYNQLLDDSTPEFKVFHHRSSLLELVPIGSILSCKPYQKSAT